MCRTWSIYGIKNKQTDTEKQEQQIKAIGLNYLFNAIDLGNTDSFYIGYGNFEKKNYCKTTTIETAIRFIEQQRGNMQIGHARISTHGQRDISHGFNIGKYIITHNGIWQGYGDSIYSTEAKPLTDTEAFFNAITDKGKLPITPARIEKAYKGGYGVIFALEKQAKKLHIIAIDKEINIHLLPKYNIIAINSNNDIHTFDTEQILSYKWEETKNIGGVPLIREKTENVPYTIEQVIRQGEYTTELDNVYLVLNIQTGKFSKPKQLSLKKHKTKQNSYYGAYSRYGAYGDYGGYTYSKWDKKDKETENKEYAQDTLK